MLGCKLKILIVKLQALGDLVIATPAIRRLRDGLPNAHIDLLTLGWTAPAAENNPCIGNLIVANYDIFFNRSLRTIIPTIQLIRQLRQEQYDVAVIFHRHKMIERFVRTTGIPVRFYFNGGQDGRTVLLDESRHSALTAWELADLAVGKLGGKAVESPFLDDLRYEWHIRQDEQQKADDILKKIGLGACGKNPSSARNKQLNKRFAVLFPGGGINPVDRVSVRRWSVDGFVDLVKWMVNDANLSVVLFGAKSDSSVCAEITARTNGLAINLSERFNLRLTAAMTARAQVVVSNDSAPLHIASAVGAPVVGIFGPTGFRHKLPPKAIAATAGLPCSPCYFTSFKACIFDSFRCFEQLTVDTVIDAVEKAMEQKEDHS
ncbi:MAG: glycosyltransferase family 9 protein [Candidatus Electryoneaceae bacterium]|nr:glycosyltransferase family 9 protein [Candidatus Electryoneaceae bacterium]